MSFFNNCWRSGDTFSLLKYLFYRISFPGGATPVSDQTVLNVDTTNQRINYCFNSNNYIPAKCSSIGRLTGRRVLKRNASRYPGPTQAKHRGIQFRRPHIARALKDQEWKKTTILRGGYLATCVLSVFVSMCHVSQVVDSMEERRFQSGDAVIEEGGPGDFFYVTGSGELEVRAPHEHVVS